MALNVQTSHFLCQGLLGLVIVEVNGDNIHSGFCQSFRNCPTDALLRTCHYGKLANQALLTVALSRNNFSL
jgi:hypothetical protein